MIRLPVANLELSSKGKAALAASEGIVPAVYLDSVGVETFGVGITKYAIGANEFSQLPRSMPVDVDGMVERALRLFGSVVQQYEADVKRGVTVPLFQHEYDALVHFAYNIGGPNFHGSRLLRLLNAGDYARAGASGFHGWLRPPELRGRRNMESQMFLTGDYGNSAIPVYRVVDGRLRGTVKTISRSEAVQMIDGDQSARQLDGIVIAKRPMRASRVQSKTLQAQTVSWLSTSGVGLLAWWSGSDQTTRIIIAVLVGLSIISGAVIFKERLIKWAKGDR